MTEHSALYTGWVHHQRLRPRRHRLRYRAYWLLLDLEEIDAVAQQLRLFSHNGKNLFSLHDRDHASGQPRALRPQIEEHLQAAGLAEAGHHISLLCIPRVLGYGFNPLSIYFCYGADGRLAALVYEVTNTFGERHSYLMPCDTSSGSGIRQRCEKRFFVSPFLDMEMTYNFRLHEPGHKLSVSIIGTGASGPIIFASLTAHRLPLTDSTLLRVFFTHPLVTQKVIGAIHWEALRLWLKGLKLRLRPAPPAQPVTTGCPFAH